MKEKLTKENATEYCKTPIDLVKYYWPNYSDQDCDFVLYERTCFPFSMEITLNQLYELYTKEQEYDKLSEEPKEYTKQQVFELFKEYHQKSVVNHTIGDLIWKQTEEWLKTKNII